MNNTDNAIPLLSSLQANRPYVLCCLDPEHKFDYERVKPFPTEVGAPYQYIFADSVKLLRKRVESRLFNIPNHYSFSGDTEVFPWHFNMAGDRNVAMFAYDLSGLKVSLHKNTVVKTTEFHFYEDSNWESLTGLIADDIPSLTSVLKGESPAYAFSGISYRPNDNFPYQASPLISGKFFYPMESFLSSCDVTLTL